MGLSNYQLILLDNLVYLDTIVDAEDRKYSVGEIVDKLLYAPGSDEAGTGTIVQDCLNAYKGGANCMMSIDEWVQVLKAIEADDTLCSLKIHKLENDAENGFRAMVLTGGENVDENVIIFKGTTSRDEWIDNGQGGYMPHTSSQIRAMQFVEGLDIVDNKSFVVSGHSKGGNMAQYVALFASNPPIDRCLNYDGQGFSEELCA